MILGSGLCLLVTREQWSTFGFIRGLDDAVVLIPVIDSVALSGPSRVEHAILAMSPSNRLWIETRGIWVAIGLCSTTISFVFSADGCCIFLMCVGT